MVNSCLHRCCLLLHKFFLLSFAERKITFVRKCSFNIDCLSASAHVCILVLESYVPCPGAALRNIWPIDAHLMIACFFKLTVKMKIRQVFLMKQDKAKKVRVFLPKKNKNKLGVSARKKN